MDIGKIVKDYYDSCSVGYYFDRSRYEYTTVIGWLNLVELKKEIQIKNKLDSEKIIIKALEGKELSGEDLVKKDSCEILDSLGIEYKKD